MTYKPRMVFNSEYHAIQWLADVDDDTWEIVKATAQHLLSAKNPRKIKKSSFRKLIKSRSREVGRMLYKEFEQNQLDDEFIAVGLVFDALTMCIEMVEPPVELPLERDIVDVKVDASENKLLELLSEMYENVFAEQVGDYVEVEGLSTDYSAFWINTKERDCVLTVGAPVRRLRDIESIKELTENPLEEKLQLFRDEYPHIPITVATHSYGYDLFMRVVERPTVTNMCVYMPHTTTQYHHHPTYMRVYDNALDATSICSTGNLRKQFLYEAALPFSIQHLLREEVCVFSV